MKEPAATAPKIPLLDVGKAVTKRDRDMRHHHHHSHTIAQHTSVAQVNFSEICRMQLVFVVRRAHTDCGQLQHTNATTDFAHKPKVVNKNPFFTMHPHMSH